MSGVEILIFYWFNDMGDQRYLDFIGQRTWGRGGLEILSFHWLKSMGDWREIRSMGDNFINVLRIKFQSKS